jgi:heat shock protein HtpX
MGIAFGLVAAIYLVAVLAAAGLFVAAVADKDAGAIFGWLFLAVCFSLVAGAHLMKIERLALRTAGATVLDDEEPELQALVRRLAAAADVPAPRTALIRSWSPNAFVVGLTPKRTVIAFTTELRRRLDEEELAAVVAHELAHIANRDGTVMTFVSGPAMLGSALWNAEDWRGKILFLYYVPVYVVGLVLMWTISRYREYVADRGACLLTGAPEQLMSALQKIAGKEPRGDLRGGAAVSALCIVPAQRRGHRLGFLTRLEIFMDHPPLDKRLRRLTELAGELGGPVR